MDKFIQNHFGTGINPLRNSASDFVISLENSSLQYDFIYDMKSSNEIFILYNKYQKQKKLDKESAKTTKQILSQEYELGLRNRANLALNSDHQFLERMVWFWSNHFAISADNVLVRSLAASYEFEAIRPNIGTNFHQLLVAAITHPAMLIYLNQWRSFGPNSQFVTPGNAKKKKIGINENLAREILELHTLGVDGGYSQKDVTEFARAMTGLTIMSEQFQKRNFGYKGLKFGQSYYEPAIHEPGKFNVLGKSYRGHKALFQILKDLANHPSTAYNISVKLARQFAGDSPPNSLIERLKSIFIETKGDLKSLYRELLQAPECQSDNALKFKNPWEWLISSMKLTKQPKLHKFDYQGILRDLGMNIWQPGSPKGFDDFEDAWASPNSLMHRIEVANILASKFEFKNSPLSLMKTVLPETAKTSIETISRAESEQVAFALILLCPEFLRR